MQPIAIVEHQIPETLIPPILRRLSALGRPAEQRAPYNPKMGRTSAIVNIPLKCIPTCANRDAKTDSRPTVLPTAPDTI